MLVHRSSWVTLLRGSIGCPTVPFEANAAVLAGGCADDAAQAAALLGQAEGQIASATADGARAISDQVESPDPKIFVLKQRPRACLAVLSAPDAL
jgi:hypothetical protein